MTNDLSGFQVVTYSSHMALRTIIRSDAASYVWFASAGSRRGRVDNSTAIGYLDSDLGEFVTITNSEEIRNVLYPLGINCISFIPGEGIQVFGNRTSLDSGTSRNRTNVARLDSYLRVRLAKAVRPFLFEQNDELTRAQVTAVVEGIMLDVQSKRGVTGWSVKCDETNNTPDRIDANELWVDLAVSPSRAVEFFYIPLRFVNTGTV
jgi:phage tail sheath protein FI